MDVTPPLPAGRSARRFELPPPPAAQPTGAALVLRRLGTAVAAVAVTGLAAAACVLSFDGLRFLALAGGARADFAYLYPAGFDALLAIALISVLLLRPARLLIRLQAVIVLAMLIVAAAAANVVVATGTSVSADQATVGIAVAPWVMLVIGLWLFLLPARRFPAYATTTNADRPAERDIVPFGGEERDPELAPPLEALPHHAHSVAVRHREPDAPVEDPSEPEITPVVPPTPAPETPTVDELPPLETADKRPAERDVPEEPPATTPAEPGGQEDEEPPAAAGLTGVAQEHTVPEPEPEQRLVPQPRPGTASGSPHRDPDRPLRWGDLVRPSSGDVLVHPLPKPAERELGDTQPYPHITDPVSDRDEPAEAHDRADEPGEASSVNKDTQPYPHLREDVAALAETRATSAQTPSDAPQDASGREDEVPEGESRRPGGGEVAAPPSGRMRSTPLPPEG
ncbi:DUF2637 domain-containing protein [Sphaerisporangium sp. NPDC051011]|uniref:DUF2637 domain-containing protein n=1 Tax=Sphaerisporangium sp. NPDC051011 TaxID=3155792 RepID=UPI0033CB9B96